MDEFLREIAADLPTTAEFLRATWRLTFAALLGALPGLEREHRHEAAGLRTHLLVSLGTAIFVLTSLELGVAPAELTRVVQGITTGIGFVGAGAILKMPEHSRVRGLTTAASIWLTAAVGFAAGAGRIWLPLLGSILAWVILAQLKRFESHESGGDWSD